MKIFKITILLAIFLFMGFAYSSCNNSTKSTDSTEKQGKEYTSAYVCPMHCEGSGSDESGSCPVCGMDYEKNENHKSDDHKHNDDSHEGHSH